jgi:hypothetical protein
MIVSYLPVRSPALTLRLDLETSMAPSTKLSPDFSLEPLAPSVSPHVARKRPVIAIHLIHGFILFWLSLSFDQCRSSTMLDQKRLNTGGVVICFNRFVYPAPSTHDHQMALRLREEPPLSGLSGSFGSVVSGSLRYRLRSTLVVRLFLSRLVRHVQY